MNKLLTFIKNREFEIIIGVGTVYKILDKVA